MDKRQWGRPGRLVCHVVSRKGSRSVSVRIRARGGGWLVGEKVLFVFLFFSSQPNGQVDAQC